MTHLPNTLRVLRARRYTNNQFVARLLMFSLLLSLPFSANADDWITTWTASPQPTWEPDFTLPTKLPESLEKSTIRQVVRVSLGGTSIRIMLSNRYGKHALLIKRGTVGLHLQDGMVEKDELRSLTIGGRSSILIPAGASAVSDPIKLSVKDRSQLAVSLYFDQAAPLQTFHWDGRQTAYIAPGDQTQAGALEDTTTTDVRLFLSRVLVSTPNKGSVVVIGDSISDGNGASMDADARWPDYLAARLASSRVAVTNAGISGGRLLRSKMGESAVARFARDVLTQPGVKTAIVLIGSNDIAWPGTAFAPNLSLPSLAELQAGYLQLINQARAHNIRLIVGTLPPFQGALEGTHLANYASPEKDALRHSLNDWIRSTDAFDAVVDFDAVLRHPEQPAKLLAKYDSGDHLHPNDAGNQAMADAISLETLFSH